MFHGDGGRPAGESVDDGKAVLVSLGWWIRSDDVHVQDLEAGVRRCRLDQGRDRIVWRWTFDRWHGMHSRTKVLMSLSMLGQAKLSFTSRIVVATPGCDWLCSCAMMFGRSDLGTNGRRRPVDVSQVSDTAKASGCCCSFSEDSLSLLMIRLTVYICIQSLGC